MLIAILVVASAVLGGATTVITYAYGHEVSQSTRMAMISHTEYRYDETAQVIARLVNFQGDPIAVDNCTTTVLFPNKSVFVDENLMATSGISGDHYVNFSTPATGPEGVYEYQATCAWNGGAQSESVTNSFHLSSAFTSIFSNITTIQNNLSQLSSDVFAVNSSLSGELSALSSQMNTNFSTLSGQLDTNVSTVLERLTELNDSLAQHEANLSVNISRILDEIDAVNATLEAFRSEVQANFSTVLNNQQLLLNNQSFQNGLLEAINATTTSTFDYVTGTLATNIDDILGQLGIINATVNRIEANTLQINSTVTDILSNQEGEVVMTTFSG